MNESVEIVRALARVVREKELAELEYEKGDLRIRLVLEHEPVAPVQAYLPAPMPVYAPQAGAAPPPPSAPAPPPAPELPGITSPLAGVFYRAPSPGAPPFVQEGDTVSPGQTLCIVEAMKLMNEITAEAPCRVVKILAENGKVVEPGQELFKVELL